MSDITEVYNKATYLPFIKYCQERKFKTMEDLLRCPFHLLGEQTDFSPLLISRIKAIYTSYCKSLPDECPQQKCVAEQGRPQPKKPMTEPELVIFLRKHFEENPDKLITLVDATKAVGGRAKKTEIGKILQQVAWCQSIEKGIFLYTPVVQNQVSE